MIPISLCMITKNESDKLDRCLAAVKDLPLEIIVVDTGSTDNSIEVARKYTEHVYHFDWISDFAAARNFKISCSGKIGNPVKMINMFCIFAGNFNAIIC